MAKNSIRDFDNTAGNNTDIQSVDIAENCAPSGINNAIRELMADMADVNDGTVALVSPEMDSADINGGTIDGTVIGGTTPAAGTFTTGDFNTSLNVDGTITSDGLTVDGGYIAVSGASTGLLIEETDTTDVNTWLSNQGGDLRLFTVNDALSVYTKRMQVDHATGDISFYEDTGTTAKFFWDASAESLGIGTSSPESTLEVRTGNNASLSSGVGHIVVGPDSRTSLSGDYSSGILFTQANGSQGGNKGASITGYQDGGDVNSTGITFNVHDLNGASNRFEAMRIDSSGNVGIGTSSISSSYILNVNGGILADGDHGLLNDSNEANFFHNLSSNSQIYFGFDDLLSGYTIQSYGFYAGNGSTTFVPLLASAFTVSSDYRLKENVTSLSDAITRLKQLSPKRFTWVENNPMGMEPTQVVDGFLAHEVKDVIPEAVHGEKDAEIGDKGDGYQRLDQSKLVPLLTAALQEAITKIETLEAKVTALENA